MRLKSSPTDPDQPSNHCVKTGLCPELMGLRGQGLLQDSDKTDLCSGCHVEIRTKWQQEAQ